MKKEKIQCDELGFALVHKKILVNEVDFKEKYPVALEQRAEKFAELLKRSEKIPPISVFGKRHKEDTYQVFDGHARLVAHKKLGLKKIDALITLVKPDGRSVTCKEIQQQ